MNIFGLIGDPLEHSFSRQYFINKFEDEGILNTVYRLYPLQDISGIRSFIDKLHELKGLNVTAPYKIKILTFLDSIETEARNIGAVNTILIKRGKNNIHLLEVINPSGTSALILGTGGAAKAVAYALNELKVAYCFISREKTGEGIRNYESLSMDFVKQYSIIINASPQGTYPFINSYPEIPYQFLNEQHFLFDLVYNLSESLFLSKGRKMGCRGINGMKMLIYQAEKSWEIWNQI